jgi:serine/threonine protein kinase
MRIVVIASGSQPAFKTSGTADYIPPEQLRGQVQASADLHSLGAALVFLLTHQSPDTLAQKRLKIDFLQWGNSLPPLP